MPHYLLDTPPRVLTLRDQMFTSSDDDGGDLASDTDDPLESGAHMNSYSTPRKGSVNVDFAFFRRLNFVWNSTCLGMLSIS